MENCHYNTKKRLAELLYAMLVLFPPLLALTSVAAAFPSYGSLAGLSREQLDQPWIIRLPHILQDRSRTLQRS